VFHDIMGGRSGTRRQVENAIRRLLAGKKPTAVGLRAIEVARGRLSGDPSLSRPSLPMEAGESGVPEGAGPAELRADTMARVQNPEDLQFLADRYDERLDFNNVISRDNAKELFLEYGGSPEGRTRFNDAVSDTSGVIAVEVYRRRLAVPLGSEALVVLTGGGTGSGKTSVLDNDERAKYSDVVFDSQTTDAEAGVRRIEQALATGREVDRLYVYREPVDAWINGVLVRADETGRPVSIDGHVASHRDALTTAIALTERYQDDPLVTLRVVDNTGEQRRYIQRDAALSFLREKLETYNVDSVRTLLLEVTDAVGDDLRPELYEALVGRASGSDRPGGSRGPGSGGEGGGSEPPPAAPAPEDGGRNQKAGEVTDRLETGEEQPRLPGAESARQAGRAETTFTAPQQASGDDFSLTNEETEDVASERERAAGPSLFDEPTPSPARLEIQQKLAETKAERDTLIQELNDRLTKQINTGVDVDTVKLLTRLARNYTKAGLLTFQDATLRLRDEYGEPFLRRVATWWERAWLSVRGEQGDTAAVLQTAGHAGEPTPQPYSIEAMRETFNLTEEQAVAVDVLVQASGIDTDAMQIVKGGTPGDGALRQDDLPSHTELLDIKRRVLATPLTPIQTEPWMEGGLEPVRDEARRRFGKAEPRGEERTSPR
jgi:hypothetical protein